MTRGVISLSLSAPRVGFRCFSMTSVYLSTDCGLVPSVFLTARYSSSSFEKVLVEDNSAWSVCSSSLCAHRCFSAVLALFADCPRARTLTVSPVVSRSRVSASQRVGLPSSSVVTGFMFISPQVPGVSAGLPRAIVVVPFSTLSAHPVETTLMIAQGLLKELSR